MTLKIDIRDFERLAKEMGGFVDQIPFAMAGALNTAAFDARKRLIGETWPGAIEARNSSFLGAALRVERATKRDLTVAVSETGPAGGRANLVAHAESAVKRPRGRVLAIPPAGTVRRGAHGIPKGQKPRAIVASTPKRALRITKQGIFVGQGGRLHLRYAFETAAQIKADVPFYTDFDRFMAARLPGAFCDAMVKAMMTRKSR